jgi:hypothetical protein
VTGGWEAIHIGADFRKNGLCRKGKFLIQRRPDATACGAKLKELKEPALRRTLAAIAPATPPER